MASQCFSGFAHSCSQHWVEPHWFAHRALQRLGSNKRFFFYAFRVGVQPCTRCLQKSGPTLEKWSLKTFWWSLKFFSCLTILEAGPHTTAPSEAQVMRLGGPERVKAQWLSSWAADCEMVEKMGVHTRKMQQLLTTTCTKWFLLMLSLTYIHTTKKMWMRCPDESVFAWWSSIVFNNGRTKTNIAKSWPGHGSNCVLRLWGRTWKALSDLAWRKKPRLHWKSCCKDGWTQIERK